MSHQPSAKPRDDDLPFYTEGGLINDRSGQATEQIRKQLKKQKPEPLDPIEEGILRINRLMETGGFGALLVSDIERILAQVEPPRAMPGIKKPPARRALLDDILEDPLKGPRLPKGFSFQYGMDLSGDTPSLGQLRHPLTRSRTSPGIGLQTL